MKTPLLHLAVIAAGLLIASAAVAQGGGRHGAGRGNGAAAPAGLGYGAGYHARRLQQAAGEDPPGRQAAPRADTACARGASPRRASDPASAADAAPSLPAPPRDGCAAGRP